MAGQPAKRIIGLHLDLKGVQFRPSYIPQLLYDLASQGVNTLLVEYEDIFPFRDIDIADDKPRVWSRARLKRFLDGAAERGIDVIPLQQCLGHLEYVLRWQRYRGFAEDRAYPGTLCLSSREGKALIADMLRQKIEAHPASRIVHIGMDEAQMGRCPKCSKRGALEQLIEYLHEICELVESYGCRPAMWTDMIEDHFQPKVFEPFRNRVLLMPWDYGARGERSAVGRIRGHRVSRKWLKDPSHRDAPAIGAGTKFFEDLPVDVKRAIKPYVADGMVRTLYQVDLYTQMGFEVVGATLLRASSHGPVLPRYNHIRANNQAWGCAIARNSQRGLVATSWERGTTFCPPNFSIDLTWPAMAGFVEAAGGRARNFFTGVPRRTVDRIIGCLSRCREDWAIEADIVAELQRLRPKVKAHVYEWDSLTLMARVLDLHRRADFVLLEVDYFEPNHRPNAEEWQRRLNDQTAMLRELAGLRRQVRAHFAKRYHGRAFEEWIRELFDLRTRRIREAGKMCRKKMKLAVQRDG